MAGVGQRNLARLAEAAFERRGDHPALLFEGREHSSSELYERGRRLAAGLAQLGLERGERVIVSMANCPEVGIAYSALWRAGLVVTPVTFLLPPAELRRIAEDSGARAVITTPELLAQVRQGVDGLAELRWIICAGEAPGDVVAVAELERAEPAAIVPRADDDLAALLYTGGTTGRAKGVMLSHGSLHYTGQAAHRAGYQPELRRSLVTLPLSHAYGLLVTLVGLNAPDPGYAVLTRWFSADEFLTLVETHRLQQSALVPTMFQLLLSQPLEEHDLSSLRSLTSGGAPLPVEVAQDFRRRVPSVSIRQGYGLTETAALVATEPSGRERPGSVGQPVPGTEVRVLDPQGRDLPRGEPGEICVRSPGLMHGYWRAPEATAEALKDGWLHTGDVGYQDEDGYLFIVDRQKDLIIRGGFNVYPRDVEDALVRHPAVEVAGVVGRPHPRHGEEVVAFVSLRGGAELSPAELVEWAREHIGGYRYPREVHVVDTVPLTPVGKIDRKALRRRLQGQTPPSG